MTKLNIHSGTALFLVAGICMCMTVSALRSAAQESAELTPGRLGATIALPQSIAFTSNRDGNNEVYVVNGDGSGATNKSNNSGNDQRPDISPDGTQIVFSSNRVTATNADGSSEIFIMNTDGSNVRQLTDMASPTANSWPRWSPDGQWIAFQSGSGTNFQIFRIRPDGSGSTQVTNYAGLNQFPAWSPNGSRLAIRRDTEIYTINSADGANPVRLTFTDTITGAFNQMAAFSPDGTRIAYLSNNRDSAADPLYLSVYIMDTNGNNKVNFTPKPSGYTGTWTSRAPDWATNGEDIYFTGVRSVTAGTLEQVFVKPVAGGNETQLTSTPGASFEATIRKAVTVPRFDFDADRKTDIGVYRPSTGVWYLNRSTSSFGGRQFGSSGDKIVPADYDGDGKTDIAVFRPSTGVWYLANSATNTVSAAQWGVSTDTPVPGDFDRDGRTDLAVFRPSNGTWWINRTMAGPLVMQYGISGDVPAVGDYDGDGKSDIAVFRPSTGIWYLRRSSLGDTAVQFGLSGDKVTPGDYDGDGKTDIAVFRPSIGVWYITNSAMSTYTVTQFGQNGDLPVPGDYNGDGKWDTAIFRPTDNRWWINLPAGYTVIQWGQTGDVPVPNASEN